MELGEWPNLVTMLFRQAERYGDKPLFWSKEADGWRPWSWREVTRQVRALSRALKDYGLQPGDRVVLVAENGPQWAIGEFAVLAAGGISVPAYTTNTAHDHAHILKDSGAVMAIVSSAVLAAPLLEASAEADGLKRVIAIEAPPDSKSSVAVTLWADAVAHGETLPGDPGADAAAIAQDALACLIYTSGTGGAPKGVMLSHRAIFANCLGAYHLLLEMGLDNEVFLSFLPLSHAYEHACGLMFPISIGAEVYYGEGVDSLVGDMADVRPTIMTSVPRLYEVMRQRILHGVQRAGGFKAKLFALAAKLGRKRTEAPGTLTLIERLLDGLVERLVRDKVRARFGGRLKAMVSGGAPLNYDVGLFFTALGVRLLQGYGQTEAAPVISCNPPSRIKLDTVGPALHSVEVRIADDGEILVRGPLLMDGYWNHPDVTAETIKDGWLHTGDIGEIDGDGYIKITDRKKDIIVLSGGDNVSPQRIEGVLCLEPEIEQVMVIGDKRPHLAALVVPAQETIEIWAAQSGGAADLGRLKDDPAFREAIGAAVSRANKSLSRVEQVKRFALADAPFTTDNEMMTPTLKVRRHKVTEHYRAVIDGLW